MQSHDLEGFPWCKLMHNSHLFQPLDEQPLVEELFITSCDGHAPMWDKVVSVQLKRGAGAHGRRSTESELVPTSNYAGVDCYADSGLLWWTAQMVDASTGGTPAVQGVGRGLRSPCAQGNVVIKRR